MLVAAGARAAPATRPMSAEDDKRLTQSESASEAGKLLSIAVHSPSEVVRLSLAGDMLSAQLLLKDTPPMARLAFGKAGVVATLQTFPPIGRQIGTSHGFSMLVRDFSPPGSMWVQTTVTATDGRIQLSSDYESSTVSGSVQLIGDAPPMPSKEQQNIDPVRVFISRNNEITGQNEVNLKLSAPTFVALCRDHPTEAQEYLRPIFHDLGEEAAVFAPNPATVWQALADDWKPDESVTKRVNDAIAKFDAEDFQERQSAAHALHEIGESAALTLMHTDRTKFSAAQSSGVDTFLAPYLPLSPLEADRLGRDREFLLDSQYCDDPALRKAAAARLAKVTGQPIGFDPEADEDTRLEQVAGVRRTFPTTSSR